VFEHLHGCFGYVIEKGIAKASAHEQNFLSSRTGCGLCHARENIH
jgi:cytochrome c551/c552